MLVQVDVVGHVPLEVSRYCWFFILRGGRISGEVVDLKARRSPIPSGGMEIKLELRFTGPARLVCRMRELIATYSWDYNVNVQVDDQQEEDDIEL
ncbi:MAG: hypothetical protein GY820_18055 [Gammaproteobacteria bacterium]|nr:hypothetical protein [Gammaproteobacteria bacterium]